MVLYLYISHRSLVRTRTFAPILNWQFLYAAFKSSKYAPIYYFLFLIRRLMYAVTLVFLDSFPTAQSLIAACLSLSVLVTQTLIYLLISRPMQAKLDSCTVILSEVSLCIMFWSLFGLQAERISWLTGSLETTAKISVYAAVFIPSIASAIGLIWKLRAVMKQFIRAKYALRVHREVVLSPLTLIRT